MHNYHSANIPRDLLWLCGAVVILVAGYFLDYTILGKYPLVIAAGFTLLMLLFPIMSSPMNGRYVYADDLLSFMPVIYAGILWRWPYQGYGGLIGSYLSLLVLVLEGVFLGATAAFFYGGICGLMLTAELLKGRFNVRKTFGLLILYSPIIMFFLWLRNNTSIVQWIQIILHPELEPMGRGFQAVQIRQVLESARWIGGGGYTTDNIPELISRQMLTYFIHRFGWISLVFVLILFCALLAFSIRLAMKQKSRLGKMVSVTVLSSLAVNGGIYIANNLGLLTFGFPVLPLLSYGNAALVANSFLIGIMLSVFRNDDIVRDPTIAPKRMLRIKITMERLP